MFRNPIVAGVQLVREAIQSANFVAGVSGWRITRTGDAEFNNATLRGELLVTDPDGSYVRVFDENPGAGAVVLVNPADFAPHVIEPGRVSAVSDDGGSTFATWMDLVGPTYDGKDPASLELRTGGGAGGGSVIQMAADTVFLGPGEIYIGEDAFVGFLLTGNRGTGAAAWSGPGAANTTTSGSFAQIPGTSSASFDKNEPFSRLRVAMTMQATSSATATDLEFGLQIVSDDSNFTTLTVTVGGIPFDVTGTHLSGTGFREVSAGDVTGNFYGAITVTPVWRRAAGAGTLTHGTRARGSYQVVESGS